MRKTTVILIWLTAAAVAAAVWMPPGNLGTNVNSNAAELDPQPVGAAGTTIYFVSGRTGSHGGYDIWATVYTGGAWQPALNLGPNVNSAQDERGPMYYEGTPPELYFGSLRTGGLGGYDLYRSVFTGGTWQPAASLTALNTTANDAQPFIVTGPLRLFFASDRAGGYGGYDLYYSAYSGGWTTPINLGADINTAADEIGPSFDAALNTLYFYSNRPGGPGNYDLYAAPRNGSRWINPVEVGAPVNTTNFEGTPGISANGAQLYFASNRPGGYGNFDIWGTNWTSGLEPTSLGRVKAAFK